MNELANYGEYSGAPSEQQTYDYAKTILSLMTREKHPEGKNWNWDCNKLARMYSSKYMGEKLNTSGLLLCLELPQSLNTLLPSESNGNGFLLALASGIQFVFFYIPKSTNVVEEILIRKLLA